MRAQGEREKDDDWRRLVVDLLARPTGIEPVTSWFVVRKSLMVMLCDWVRRNVIKPLWILKYLVIRLALTAIKNYSELGPNRDENRDQGFYVNQGQDGRRLWRQDGQAVVDGSRKSSVSRDGEAGDFAEGEGVRRSPVLAWELAGDPKEADGITLGNDRARWFRDEPSWPEVVGEVFFIEGGTNYAAIIS